MKKMFTLAAVAALAFIAVVPANASGYIPLGKKQYTTTTTPGPITTIEVPEQIEVIPGAVTPAYHVNTGSGSPSDNAVSSEKCEWTAMDGSTVRQVNVDANCTALSIVDSNSGYTVPASRAKDTVNVTPASSYDVQGDPVTVTTCQQPGWSHSGGLGYYSCN